MNSRTRRPRLTFSERCDEALFRALSSRNLIYNTCWEDPRLDRVALQLGPQDNVLVITSAGCNALDYALWDDGWTALSSISDFPAMAEWMPLWAIISLPSTPQFS